MLCLNLCHTGWHQSGFAGPLQWLDYPYRHSQWSSVDARTGLSCSPLNLSPHGAGAFYLDFQHGELGLLEVEARFPPAHEFMANDGYVRSHGDVGWILRLRAKAAVDVLGDFELASADRVSRAERIAIPEGATTDRPSSITAATAPASRA